MSRIAFGLSAGLALALAGTAAAQNPGLPVINSGVGTGITLSGDVGFPNSDAGSGTAFGGTGKIGLGPLGVTATISSYKPKGGQSHISLGGSVNWKVFGGPLIPFAVNLQVGAARTKIGSLTLYHVPIGLGLSAKIPTTLIGIKPWIAPRVDISRLSGPSSSTGTHFGISAGVEFNLLSGLGLHIAYDRLSADGGSPSVFGIGVHYGLTIPGL